MIHTVISLDVLRWGVSPNKIVEYMAAGKPVVTTIEKNDSIVEQAQAGLSVAANRPEKLADAIAYLYKNPQIREEMGLKGYNFVRKNLSFDSVVKDLIEKLKTVLQ